jgi:hypothetical protein
MWIVLVPRLFILDAVCRPRWRLLTRAFGNAKLRPRDGEGGLVDDSFTRLWTPAFLFLFTSPKFCCEIPGWREPSRTVRDWHRPFVYEPFLRIWPPVVLGSALLTKVVRRYLRIDLNFTVVAVCLSGCIFWEDVVSRRRPGTGAATGTHFGRLPRD